MSFVLPSVKDLIDKGVEGDRNPVSFRDTAEFRVQCGIYEALRILCGSKPPLAGGYSPHSPQGEAKDTAQPTPPPASPPGKGAQPKPKGKVSG